jgi:hypothetical protein
VNKTFEKTTEFDEYNFELIIGFERTGLMVRHKVEALARKYPEWTKPLWDVYEATGRWPRVHIGKFKATPSGRTKVGTYYHGQSVVRLADHLTEVQFLMTLIHEVAHMCQYLELEGYRTDRANEWAERNFPGENTAYRLRPSEMCANDHSITGVPREYKWTKEVLLERFDQWLYHKMEWVAERWGD